MDSGTYYLYEYENAVKKRNAGFMKIFRHPSSCIFQIRAHGLAFQKNAPLEMHTLSFKENHIKAAYLTAVKCSAYSIHARFPLDDQKFPKEVPFADINGFLFRESADQDHFLIASEQNLPSLPITFHTSATSSTDWIADKVTLADLKQLPPKYHFLAKNSFLLHGFHNYGHLLLIHQNDHMWLGVPGIFDLREARAADLFGFPHFIRAFRASDLLSEEERCSRSDFGHWCRCIK